MKRNLLFVTPLLLVAGVALANDPPEPEGNSGAVRSQAPPAESADNDAETQPAPATDGVKTISGMSILGNQEAPTSLVIVPWKSSVLGDSLWISTMLDDSKQPIDKEVFMRALSYYEIRSKTKP